MEHPQKKVVDPATRELIDRLFVERISLAGMARAVQVSEQWLQTYVNQKYTKVSRSRASGTQKKGRLTMQYGELWFFVDNKSRIS